MSELVLTIGSSSKKYTSGIVTFLETHIPIMLGNLRVEFCGKPFGKQFI